MMLSKRNHDIFAGMFPIALVCRKHHQLCIVLRKKKSFAAWWAFPIYVYVSVSHFLVKCTFFGFGLFVFAKGVVVI